MRILAAFGVVACLVLPARAEAAAEQAWTWVEAALRAELAAPRADLNKVASLAFPLASRHPESPALDETAAFLGRRPAAQLSCREIPDHLLIAGFLEMSGRYLDTAQALQRRDGCRQAPGSLFDRVGLLLSACLFSATPEDPRRTQPGNLEIVTSRQGPDGAFRDEWGRPDYYLSSHATLALWACGGDRAAVWRGQQYLARSLAPFRRIGFLDGLAESLIFLKWMEVPVPGWEDHAAHLLGKAGAEGGLCYRDGPGCAPDWHATSLLVELEPLAKAK